MKKLIIILLILLPLTVNSQDIKNPDFKDYKVCTECFQSEQWHKTGLDNYGIVSSPRQKKQRGNGYLSQTGKSILGGVTAIFVGALTLLIYNSATNATTH